MWSNGSSANNITVSPTASTSYTVTGNTLGCTGSAIAPVFVAPKPVIFSNSTTICDGESSTLLASGALTYTWSNGDLTDSTVIHPSKTKSYTVIGNIGLCSDTTVGTVTVIALPRADFTFTPDPAGIVDPEITFTDQSSPDVNYWLWDFGDGNTLSPNIKDPIHRYPAEVSSYMITLKVMNPGSCESTVSHNLIIAQEFSFYIPNAFSPNNDNMNDVFGGSGAGILKFRMSIFDRWGNLIFTADDINKPWDGKTNSGGEAALQDIYIWKVTITDVFKKAHDFMGTVTIIR